MAQYCCVPRCTQNGYRDGNGDEVSFHFIPENEDLRKRWLVAIERGPPFNIRTATVCSKHFVDDDFLQNAASGTRILRDNAIPSVFAFKEAAKQEGCEATVACPREAEEKCSEEQAKCTSAKNPSENEKNLGEPSSVQPGSYQPDATTLHISTAPLKREKEIIKLQPVDRFCIEKFKDSADYFLFYTGLPCYGVFQALLTYLEPALCDEIAEEDAESESAAATRDRPSSLSIENQLFLVLVRLRLGLSEQDLAHRFNIHESMVSSLFETWINFMYLQLAQLPLWASRAIVDEYMPESFKQKYPRTRVIIDTTVLQCEVQTSFVLQSERYSPYKLSTTFKGLVGISPNGLVTFISSLFTGSISNKELVRRSGFLSMSFEEGDVVMANNGIPIRDLLKPLNVELNTPPFLGSRLIEAGEIETEAVASLHIQVERMFRRIKNFHIFDLQIPLTIAPIINQVWTVCAILTNFQPPPAEKN